MLKSCGQSSPKYISLSFPFNAFASLYQPLSSYCDLSPKSELVVVSVVPPNQWRSRLSAEPPKGLRNCYVPRRPPPSGHLQGRFALPVGLISPRWPLFTPAHQDFSTFVDFFDYYLITSLRFNKPKSSQFFSIHGVRSRAIGRFHSSRFLFL